MATEKIYWDPEKPWGNELVANTLVERGVDTVFALTGGHVAPMLTAMAQKGIKVIATRTEQSAVLAAMGYSLESEKVGVAVVTAGMLGFAHPAMMTASWGQVPVVVIGGASATTVDGLRDLQEVDQMPIARSAQVKEAIHCTKVERIPQMLTWAFKTAQSGIPGCTFIDLPIDLLCSRADIKNVEKFKAVVVDAQPSGDPKLIKDAIKLLSSAKNPIINVSRMGAAANIQKEIKEFVKITGVPVDTCLGTLGEDTCNIGMPVCPDADVVLQLGKMSQGVENGMNKNSYLGKIISVYPDAADMGRVYPVYIGIVGNIKLVLQQMIEEAKSVKWPDFSAWVKSAFERREGAKAMFASVADTNNKPIHPARLAKETVEWMIANKINKNSILALDGADNIYWYAMMSAAYGVGMTYPGQMHGQPSLQITLGAVGMALPSAFGAACASPNKFVFVPTMGDGSIGYHMMELGTFAEKNIPMVIVLHNNSMWSMVYADQRRIWGREEQTGSYLPKEMRYDKIAEALGCAQSEFITEPADIRPALDRAYKRAMKEKKPVVVNVITDPNIYVMPWPWMTLPATEKGEPYTGLGKA